MSVAANDPMPTLEAIIAAAVKEALDKRMPPLAAVGLVPPRYVVIQVAALVTGLTEKAINSKIDAGVFLEGEVWRRGPDGKRYFDFRGFEAWVEGGRKGE